MQATFEQQAARIKKREYKRALARTIQTTARLGLSGTSQNFTAAETLMPPDTIDNFLMLLHFRQKEDSQKRGR